MDPKQIARDAVEDYYRTHPVEPVEFTTRELVVISMGLIVGGIIAYALEERETRKRLDKLEKEMGKNESK